MLGRILFSVFCAAVLAIFSVLPIGQRLDRNFGLGLLYDLRGDVQVPSEAVIIGLDEDSVSWLQRNIWAIDDVSNGLGDCLTPHAIETLEQARTVYDVPRAVYICLLRLLATRNPKQVVFDINFNADKPDDPAFATEIAANRNVVLLELISAGEIVTRRRPARVLNDAATKVVSFQVSGAGNIVTVGYPTSSQFAPAADIMPIEVWRLFTGRESQVDTKWPDIQPIWYYGGPRTVPTYSLRQVFDIRSERVLPGNLSERVVFIGFSEANQANAEDHFLMPGLLSEPRVISGVEIAATAFLNILNDDRLMSFSVLVSGIIIFTSVFALFASAICFSGRKGYLMVGGIGTCYLGVAVLGFSSFHLWIPVAILIFVALPGTLLAALLQRYAGTRKIVRMLAPRPIAEQLLEKLSINRDEAQVEQATIMFVDVESSTRLGEYLGTNEFQQVMSRYYDEASSAVERNNNGIIVEFMGDGILALFTETISGPHHANLACRAATELSEAAQFIQTHPSDDILQPMKLRFGLHSGSVSTGVVGSAERFNYGALGDSVNTAARLEEFGKHFSGERSSVIILSGETREKAGLRPEKTRFIKRTQLRGRVDETDIFRLIGSV